MRKTIFGGLCVALALGSFMLSHNPPPTKALSSLALANLDALSSSETEFGSETGYGNLEESNPKYKKCMEDHGVWKAFSECINSGFEQILCNESGKINFFGTVIKNNSYKSGLYYYVPWAKYECIQSTQEYCCTKYGMYAAGTKIQ